MRTNEWQDTSIALAKPSAEQFEEPALQVFLRREGDRVHEDVEPAPLRLRSRRTPPRARPAADVERQEERRLELAAPAARRSGRALSLR